MRFVLEVNLQRRHLNESQRAMVAARVATTKAGGDRKSEDFKTAIAVLKQSDAARLLNTSVEGIQRARVVQEHGLPELALAVESGRVAVSVAAFR